VAVTERILRAQALGGTAALLLGGVGQFPLTGEDALRINVINNAAFQLRLLTTGRYLKPGDTSVSAFADSYVIDSSDTAQTHEIGLTEGTLLNLVIRATNKFVPRGRCFVRIEVLRGRGAAATVIGTLLAGYVGSWGGLAWPGTPLEDPLNGRGYVETFSNSATGPGELPLVTMPPNREWLLTAACTTLTTDATVATRTVYLRVFQNGALIYQAPSSRQQGASLAAVHSWGAGSGAVPDPTAQLGIGTLPVGFRLSTNNANDTHLDLAVNGFAVGDFFSLLKLQVEEWIRPSDIL